MKRFAVFAYDTYYPGGGMSDFQKSFDNEQEANNYASEIIEKFDNIYVEDLKGYE